LSFLIPISFGLLMPSFDDISSTLFLKIGRAVFISQPLYSFVIRSECSLADDDEDVGSNLIIN
jgi:hypothetical protein